MAYSVEITGYPATGDKPLWNVETPWWDDRELRDDPRFKEASECPGYYDYEAVMTVDEAKLLVKKYANKTTLDHFLERSKDLTRKLADRKFGLDRVLITVFEWESGF